MKKIKNLCVFCGSKVGIDPLYSGVAEKLGTLIADHGIRLVYGGGKIGLMGIIAKSVMDAGGMVTGIIPDFLLKLEVAKTNIDQLIVVEKMHERKSKMFELSDGIVILPGGLGTLDETFEVITWKQLRKHDKPIILVSVNDYWAPFDNLIKSLIGNGFGHSAIAELYTIVHSVEAVFPALKKAPKVNEAVLSSHL